MSKQKFEIEKSNKGKKEIKLKSVHKEPKVHKCDPCGKLFTATSSLRRHIKIIHEGRKDFNCDSCENHLLKMVN